jgi:hypothetical protein
VVFCVAFSPDGKLLASAGGEEFLKNEDRAGEVNLWDVTTGKELRRLGTVSTVTSVAFSPDGTRLATGSVDKTVVVWDIASGRGRSHHTGQTGVVRCVAYSPDGRTLASGNFDGTVKVWETATGKPPVRIRDVDESRAPSMGAFSALGKELATLKGLGGPVLSVAFSPDGKVLAEAGGQPGKPGRALLWSVGGPAPARPRAAADRLDQHLDRLGKLLREVLQSNRSDEQAVEVLYLAALARFPSEAEKMDALKHLASQRDRREALANVLWVLVNSRELGASGDVLQKLNRLELFAPRK